MNSPRLALLSALATAVAAAPLHAAPIDWAAAKFAFEEGMHSAAPSSEDEYAGCGAFWANWNAAVEQGKVPAEIEQEVSSTLVAPSSTLLSYMWLLWIRDGDNPETTITRFDEISPFAASKVDEMLAGDPIAVKMVMNILGACRIPDSL